MGAGFPSPTVNPGGKPLLDQRHLLCGKFPTTKPLLICRQLHAIVLSVLLRTRTRASWPAKNGRDRKNLSRLPPNHSRFQTGKKGRPITLAECYLGNDQHSVDLARCITNRFLMFFLIAAIEPHPKPNVDGNIDEPVKNCILDGYVKIPRSRFAGRGSELERANRKLIFIFTANIHVPSR